MTPVKKDMMMEITLPLSILIEDDTIPIKLY
jgi:hypothetical protein